MNVTALEFGDPCPNNTKKLTVYFRCGEVKLRLRYPCSTYYIYFEIILAYNVATYSRISYGLVLEIFTGLGISACAMFSELGL